MLMHLRPLAGGNISVPSDTTPDAFAFTDQTNVALSTVIESNTITVAGINASTSISITGGEHNINSAGWSSASSTVTNGQTIQVRHTSSGSNSTTTDTVLTVGGVSDTFTSTTLASGVTFAMNRPGGLTTITDRQWLSADSSYAAALSGEDTNDWTWYGGGASLDIDVVIIPVGA